MGVVAARLSARLSLRLRENATQISAIIAQLTPLVLVDLLQLRWPHAISQLTCVHTQIEGEEMLLRRHLS